MIVLLMVYFSSLNDIDDLCEISLAWTLSSPAQKGGSGVKDLATVEGKYAAGPWMAQVTTGPFPKCCSASDVYELPSRHVSWMIFFGAVCQSIFISKHPQAQIIDFKPVPKIKLDIQPLTHVL